MRKEKRFLPKKFPADVARFFNPQKTETKKAEARCKLRERNSYQ